MFKDKYNLPKDENILLAKKTLVENIYSQAKMINVNITFLDTKAIIDGKSVSGIKPYVVQYILRLRNAWLFVLDDVSAQLDQEYVDSVRAIVTFGGVPQLFPNINKNNDQINDIFNSSSSSTEKALDYFLFVCYSKLFWEENKLTASIIANKIMIEAGVGIFVIREKYLHRFNSLIVDFYVTADDSKIKPFLYRNCVLRID